MTISVIGCGNIGGALARALVEGKHQVLACDPDEVKLGHLGAMGALTTQKITDTAESEAIILAVKPNDVPAVLTTIRNATEQIVRKPLIISVAAGVLIDELRELLGSEFRIVRVMPNLPVSIREGMSVVYAENEEDALIAEMFFSSMGKVVILPEESQLAIATGLSGSGPAFVFLMCQGFIEAGLSRGLTPQVAREMACQTIVGAAKLVMLGEKTPEDLIRAVATPGGTTDAGLNVLKEGKFQELLTRAVLGAAKRAREKLSVN